METLINISTPVKQETILDKATLFHGNNMEALSKLADNSIDSVVTDPPYGISFMGNKWDYDVPSVEFWREVLRVLKPGGHVLSFGGTRTYHRMVINIEDAGFEIRDQIMWIYGQGFPKSRNIGVDVDKILGNERKIIGKKESQVSGGGQLKGQNTRKDYLVTKGETDFEGWGTNLKPANEPIVMARKPLFKKTIGENVIEFGTGAININGCRINSMAKTNDGRFPTNVLFDEPTSLILDAQSGISKSGKNKEIKGTGGIWRKGNNLPIGPEYGDEGGASRFFYVCKPSKKERHLGLRNGKNIDGYDKTSWENNHPTVKPVELMRYLVRLVTPKGGVVLDPFMGSGSTGIATLLEGFDFVGMEVDHSYFKIAKQRISSFDEVRVLKKKEISKKKNTAKAPIKVFGLWGNQGLLKAS
jgi:site-specific DNA-methyltransferase (adenine-specific)